MADFGLPFCVLLGDGGVENGLDRLEEFNTFGVKRVYCVIQPHFPFFRIARSAVTSHLEAVVDRFSWNKFSADRSRRTILDLPYASVNNVNGGKAGRREKKKNKSKFQASIYFIARRLTAREFSGSNWVYFHPETRGY